MSEIVYPKEYFCGEKVGNYIRPNNYEIPNFCEGCPIAQDCQEPRISRATGADQPVNSDGVKHLGIATPMDALIMSDAADGSTFEPVYIETLPIVSVFSADHEDPVSQVLGYAHYNVGKCNEPQTKQGIFRKDKQVCGSGLMKISNFRVPGHRIAVSEADLSKNVIVPGPINRDTYKNKKKPKPPTPEERYRKWELIVELSRRTVQVRCPDK